MNQSPASASLRAKTCAEPSETGAHALKNRSSKSRRGLGKLHATREKIRANKPAHHTYRVAVFLIGLCCVLLGLALSPLPGPLTIPPILLGVYIWSTEFDWAHRWYEKFKKKARAAWKHAQAHPYQDGIFTAAGLIAAGVMVWAAMHYEFMEKAKEWLVHWWNG